MKRIINKSLRTVDPILILPVQSEVSSICFVSHQNLSLSSPEHNRSKNHSFCQCKGENYNDDNSSLDDEGDGDEIELRSSKIRIDRTDPKSSRILQCRLLSDRFLASCHSNGEALIWNLKNQKQVACISPPRGKNVGLCIRRTDDPSQIMLQTRDSKGLVSIHSIERCGTLGEDCDIGTSSTLTKVRTSRQFETYSKTFCRAAPCHGNRHLIALPDIDHSSVTVVDTRSDSNVAKYHIGNHGMVTSLALSVTSHSTGNSTGRPILACGMESGTTHFFDVMHGPMKSSRQSSLSIGKDPVLTLDFTPSYTATYSDSSVPAQRRPDALLVAAGMAGDAQDVSELSKDEAGRAVLFKTTYCGEDANKRSWNFKQRARLSTCRVDHESYCGKPGIAVCCFRPKDGRFLAIGGWDKRIRLFERSSGNMVALLKGNARSVADLDWAPDSITSGLLASAHKGEKSITLWQCFPK